MLYTIKEDSVLTNQEEVDTGAFPIYNVTNDFEMFYVPTDTVNSCYYNKFTDITETNNKIYLISINYSDTIINYPTEHASYIDIISFDKQTRQQQAGRINLPYPVHQSYGVKTTAMNDDDIAIACNLCYNQHYNYGCAFKVSPNANNLFNISNISLFDYLAGRFSLLDVEYLTVESELVVLKKSIINEEKKDMIFHLNMEANTPYSYNSYKYKINYEDNYDLYCNDLNKSSPSDYTVFGNIYNNIMFAYDTKNDAYLTNSSCFTKELFQVTTLTPFTATSVPTLSQCSFSKQITINSSILYLSTNVDKVVINLTTIPFNKYSVLEEKCIK